MVVAIVIVILLYFLSMPNTNSALFNNLQQQHVKYFTKIKFAIQMSFSQFQLPNNKNLEIFKKITRRIYVSLKDDVFCIVR